MNIHGPLVEAATHALGLVLKFELPADAVLSNYFRAHGALGQHDRGFVAEAVFGVLRHKRVLDHVTEDGNARLLILGWLARYSGLSMRDMSKALKSAELESTAQMKAISLDSLPNAVRAELPDWIYTRLTRSMSEADIGQLGRALQNPAPLDLRVNTLHTDRERVLRELELRGIEARETVFSPVGVRIPAKTALNREALFLEGAVEVQDEGSQLVGYLMAPRRNELVVDFCAGAGGKALMLGAMMHSQGRVYAFDVSPARLSRLKPRLKRSGLSNLHPHLLRSENDPKVKRLAGKIDRVLVDAPCTGLGTLRRNPDLKWRQSPGALEVLRHKQSSILNAAAGLVKRGGRLVYATCSLLQEENEDVVEHFLTNHPDFRPLDCGEILRHQGIDVTMPEHMRLWPHVHQTDGFFGAAFERSERSSFGR